MTYKNQIHGFFLLSITLLSLTACFKDDDCKQETRCKVKSIDTYSVYIEATTGNITTYPYELVNTFGKNCDPIIRQVSLTEEDSCVYQNGKLTEIHRLKGILGTGNLETLYSYYLNYGGSDNPIAITKKNDIFILDIDSLFYENEMLVKAITYTNYSGNANIMTKFNEKNYVYHQDGNLNEVNTIHFDDQGEFQYSEKEIFENFVDIKNPSYQSPFPDERNLSLSKNLYEKYEKYGQTQTLDGFQYVDYSQLELNDCGYQKLSYEDYEIQYQCGCN